MSINQYIDHTLLKSDATEAQIRNLCQEAIKYQFCTVCINGSYIPLAHQVLKNSAVKIVAVIGFPLGAMSTAAKVFEATQAINSGANEIDMVINVGFLKDEKYDLIQDEISQIKKAIGNNILKVIIETCLLTDQMKKKMCQIVIDAGAEYIKTSTGFSTSGANIEDIQLLLDATQGKILVKAAGGIKNSTIAQEYINMGVSRLGTSSGVDIIQGLENSSGY